jgi:hypothetical protein
MMNLATKDQLNELIEKVDDLSRQVKNLEGRE